MYFVVALAMVYSSLMFCVHESTKFLLSRGRYDEARQIFAKIAQRNVVRGTFSERFSMEVENNSASSSESPQASEVQRKGSLKDLCIDKKLRRNLMLATYLWITVSFNYYLISFYMKYINGSIYLNNFLSALADFLGNLSAGFVITKAGMKRSIFGYYALTGIFGFGLIFTQDNAIIVPICVFVSKFGISSAFNGMYLSSPMLFPPYLLSTSFAVCNVLARAATIVSPMVAELEGAVPMVLVLGMSILAMILVPFLIIQREEQGNDAKKRLVRNEISQREKKTS